MLPIEEPVWLAIFLPLRSDILVMPRSLRTTIEPVAPTVSIWAMATRPPLSWPMMKDGPA